MLILRKVLNSHMTGCVSYFAATYSLRSLLRTGLFVSQGGWEKEKKKGARHESWLTSLGRRFVGRVESALFLDLQFRHSVYVWLNRYQYWKLQQVSIFPTGEDWGQSKDTRQATMSIGHISKCARCFFKTFKKNIIDLLGQEARKFGLKNVLASPKLDCSQSSIFP